MKYILISLFFLLCTYSTAQKFSINNLNKTNGLSSNYVNDIVQDQQGFIWIATEAGLDRFDGKNFTNYNTTNSNLCDATIKALLYDQEENLLWIGTKANLSILDCSTSKIRNYKDFNGIPLCNIVHLAHSKDNKIWITNYYGGIVCYDKIKKHATHYSSKTIKGLINDNWCTFDDGKGNLYIGHTDKGLSIINLYSKTLHRFYNDPRNSKSLPGNTVFTINSDRQGNIWVGTNQGLALFNPHKNEFITFKHNPNDTSSLVGNQIYCIREMNDGSIWISADIGGISILDFHPTKPESVRFTNILPTEEFNLSSGNIRSLLQDSFGNIWIGNFSRGLDFISHIPTSFHILTYGLEGDKNKSVWGIYVDNKDRIWIGSENEIAFFLNNQLQQTYDLTPYQGKYSSPIFSIIGDNQENMFFGMMEDGLIKLDNTTKELKRIDSKSTNLDIITFFEEKGKIWIGTRNGIYIYSEGKLEKESHISDQLTAQSVYGIRRDKQGNLWIGTYGAGIFIFDTRGTLTKHLSMQQGFFSNAISYLFTDSQGGLWAASRDAGLCHIPDTASPENFYIFGVKEGLKSLFIRAIQEDKSGNIWFSSDNGISCWNRKTQNINNYDNYDGIPIGNFIDGSVTSATDGTIYFGSLNGVCYFKPTDIIVKHSIAPIQIIECRNINTQVENGRGELLTPSENNNIELSYNQNSFRISFVIPDYAYSSKVEYSYMMDGLQEVWSGSLEDNQVTFRNISPGEYTFRVKARLKNQDWDEENIATLNIQISPPLWLSVYAKMVYLLVVFLIIYLVIRSYKKRLKLKSLREIERKNILNEQNLNQERIGFYTNITHELRTPLTLILGPLEDLTKDSKLPAHYSTKINRIYASAIQLLNLINQLLEFRKTETRNRKLVVTKRDISNLVTEIGLYYVELNRNPDLKFNIQVNTEQTIIYVDAEIVTIILNNLLSNAVKYTPKGEISITLSSIYENGDGFTEIKVSDTGYGITPDALPYIFDRYFQAKSKYQAAGTGIGLSIVKSLVELHEGTINVESEPGRGTTFCFRLLTENTYKMESDDKGNTKSVFPSKGIPETEEDSAPDSLMILVVEDNTQICEYITSSLSQDYLIITAENGKKGLLQAQEKVPNIIISDILMPEMDGIEFCRLVKNDIRTSHIPVILLTARDSILDKEKGYESGADSYITKPFSISLLRGRIQNLLDNRRRLANQVISDTKEVNSLNKILRNTLDEEFLSKLTNFILENIDDPQLDVPLLAKKINMNYSAFYRKVKALTGLSPNEFIRKVKVKKSAELLLAGPYNISEVAYMTGFNDVPYFRRCFKEEYGMAPSEYIKKMNS